MSTFTRKYFVMMEETAIGEKDGYDTFGEAIRFVQGIFNEGGNIDYIYFEKIETESVDAKEIIK